MNLKKIIHYETDFKSFKDLKDVEKYVDERLGKHIDCACKACNYSAKVRLALFNYFKSNRKDIIDVLDTYDEIKALETYE